MQNDHEGGQGATFQDYLANRSLPARGATIRSDERACLTLTLVDHAPNAGVWFDPIDDLVVSIVLRSNRSRVVRDVGYGKLEFTYAPGCALLTPPGQSSYWRFEGNPQVLHLSAPRSGLARILESDYEGFEGSARRASRLPCFDPLVPQLAMRIWKASSARDPSAASVSQRAFGLLLALFTQQSGATNDRSSKGFVPMLASWRLGKALGAISTREGRTSATELADSVDLSCDYFRRVFKASTGLSPHAMASRMRVEKAKRLLGETRRSATDIAFDLGFSSASHFSTRFKQLTGMSPTRWRATYLECGEAGSFGSPGE